MKRAAQLLAGVALLAGCAREPTATEATASIQAPAAAHQVVSASEQEHRNLTILRRVTAPFKNFETAMTAGWSAKITSCMVSPAGGMGFHYGNTHLIDSTVRVDQPELLLYEPGQHGRLRLVAVEYIIPYTAHSRSAEPPVLFGQQFKQNDAFQLWGLHVWVWKDNPSGLYADWNPRVTCDNSTDVSVMTNH